MNNYCSGAEIPVTKGHHNWSCLRRLWLCGLVSICFSTAVVVPMHASAGCGARSCESFIDNIFIPDYDSGNVHVRPDEPLAQMDAALDCFLEAGQYIVLKKTHPSFAEIYAVLLTSFASGHKVAITTAAGTGRCDVVFVHMRKRP
jgi:hypothetical protein